MTHPKAKCIVILSSKSAGSSALQNLLAHCPEVRHVARTPHYEHETLYWTKAASLLGMPQVPMLDSEVPFSQAQARTMLTALLRDNLPNYTPPGDDQQLIFEGWRQLCQQFGPVFLEKSPHHLHQWSSIELLLRCAEQLPEIEFLLVGLVRNPMDVLYSMWDRWRSLPERHQYEWYTAYRNLQRLQGLLGERLVVVRYEDIISNPAYMNPIYDFIGVQPSTRSSYLHRRSVAKWKRDRAYGFTLAPEVMALAQQFGYQHDELCNDTTALWPLKRLVARSLYRSLRPLRLKLRAAKRGG